MRANKKLVSVLIFIFVLSVMSGVSFAWGGSTIYPADVIETPDIMFFEISRPLTFDSTTSKYFYICGEILYDDVTVETFIFSDLDGCYVPFGNIYGESKYQALNQGFFNSEIILPNKGENKLLVVAYRTPEPDSRQFSKLNVFLRSETIAERVMNGLDKALNFFSNLLP